jgi:arabinofuranosyltransferase
MQAPLIRRRCLLGGAVVCLALLLAHAWVYRFLTDDAFISFRYAKNLSLGHGLVFNPGYERVEGYTNFLWVILLAGFDGLGIAPERIANSLSILCGVAIWALILRASLRPGRPIWLALAPVVLLAATRSFAVWCTSGLETKLFEFLAFAGALRAVSEAESARAGGRETWLYSSLLLALMSLTRPDGVIIAGGILGTRWFIERRRGGARLGPASCGISLLVAILIAHLAFRLAYYGEWLPNTYHAKVGGRTWWSMGLAYIAAFSVEYVVLLWLPLLAAAWIGKKGSGSVPARAALLTGAIVPFVAYVVAIGGDHFEYRPLDLVFPFAYVLMADGAEYLYSAGRWTRRLVPALLGLVLLGVIAVPGLSHLDFPLDYRAGFPGASSRADGTRDLVSEKRFPALFKVPGLNTTLRGYNSLMAHLTLHGVGIRQEEHRKYLELVTVPNGKFLGELVRGGVLPADTYIAIGAVGAIPYYSGLRTLDQLGLTDRVVAQGPNRPPAKRIMAHDKLASIEYARERGVDLWAPEGSHFLFRSDYPGISTFADRERELGAPLLAGPLDDETLLLAFAPCGLEQTVARIPTLEDAATYFDRAASQPDPPWWASAYLGDLLAARGDPEAAYEAYVQALALNPKAGHVEFRLGLLLFRAGETEEAIPHFARALEIRRTADALSYLGLALYKQGKHQEAFELIRSAAESAPDHVAVVVLYARFLIFSDDPGLRDSKKAVEIGERLKRLTRGRDVPVLDTLAAAYAAVGRFDDARREAERAVAIAQSLGETGAMEKITARADAYAIGKSWF